MRPVAAEAANQTDVGATWIARRRSVRKTGDDLEPAISAVAIHREIPPVEGKNCVDPLLFGEVDQAYIRELGPDLTIAIQIGFQPRQRFGADRRQRPEILGKASKKASDGSLIVARSEEHTSE